MTPCDDAPWGGVRKIYRFVDILNGAGIDAAVFHAVRGFRCSWFANETRVVYPDLTLRAPEDVLAAHPTSDFDAKVPMVTGSSDRFVGQLYAELKPAK